MDLLEYVGNRIRELRNTYRTTTGTGLSQEALANELKVAPNTVSRWETATYKPTIEDLEKISRFFGVSITTFFPKEDLAPASPMEALLRAAKELDPADQDELRRYAEFRRARHLYAKKSAGRKRGK